MTGVSSHGLAPFDRVLETFLAKNHIPGAAPAVAREGRLVLARGYGWADLEARKPVQPTSLFRVASLSKAVTAAAVLRLIERGRLTPKTKPFGLLGIEPFLPAGAGADPRLKRVTLFQLIHHTGGFDRKTSFDPMFRPLMIARVLGTPPPAGPRGIIRYMLGRSLDFDPGTRFAYSNFGYCVLGRVIEKAAGMTYEDYVKKNVLEPICIHRMGIGRTLLSGREPGEVTYYVKTGRNAPSPAGKIGAPVDPPYGSFHLEAMDSHGGWIASVVDMVRFASAFDDPGTFPILPKKNTEVMFARPPGPAGFDGKGRPKPVYYAWGWQVRSLPGGKSNQWHTGSLPGTATLMVRRHDGLCRGVFFNTRNDPAGGSLTREIDPLLHRAADSVEKWPSWDLFPRYLRPSSPGRGKKGRR